MKLNCNYFNQSHCRSCTGLDHKVEVWREKMFGDLKQLLISDKWLEPLWSNTVFGSRTKAKFAVSGTVDQPVLGRSLRDGSVVDLRDCALHDLGLIKQVPQISEWITQYNLTPYDALTRTGELKFVIFQLGADDQLMVRFILRSKEALDRFKKLVDSLDLNTPYKVITANIQPEPKAILEGEHEIVLTPARYLPIKIGDASLLLGPKSFCQTNLYVAGELYQTAKKWLSGYSGRFLDLFCGIGGFAAHLVDGQREVVGVELSLEAIEAAKQSVPGATFYALDAWKYIAESKAFDVVVVNPPRRGLGSEICGRLNQMKPKYILYSSCNPKTLNSDLESLDYKIDKIKAFEMFPMTEHWEVLTLLSLNPQ